MGYCEKCKNDPCICDDGFSVKDSPDETLLDSEIFEDDSDSVDITQTLLDEPVLDLEEKEESLFDDEDDGIDLSYIDEENLL